MKILFAMASPEYIRYYDSTIELLAERRHEIALAVNVESKKGTVDLDDFSRRVPGVRVAGVVPARSDVFQTIARALRGTVDYVRFLHPRYAQAHALRARMARKVLPEPMGFLKRFDTLPEGRTRALIRLLGALELAVPSSRRVEDFLRHQHPDLVFVTPLVEAGSDQVDLVKSAKALGMRTVVGIPSWDNLTNKGLLRIQPDLLLVWNDFQKAEAIELHGARPEKVVATGAQVFDRWFQRAPSRDREPYCRLVGLPTDRPILLFVGSTAFISRPAAEVEFVRRWVQAIRGAHDPSTSEASILVRPHPFNAGQWRDADLSMFPNAVVWPREPANPADDGDRMDYFDSLYHSAAVVGVNTSAMIEAAIIGKPVFSILEAEFQGTQEGTLHFHYLLPENGGFLRVAPDLETHVAQLSEVVAPDRGDRNEAASFVRTFVRPYGLETAAAPRVVEALERVFREPSPRAIRPGFWMAPVQGGLRVASGALELYERAGGHQARARLIKDGRRALKKQRKELRKSASRAARRLSRLRPG